MHQRKIKNRQKGVGMIQRKKKGIFYYAPQTNVRPSGLCWNCLTPGTIKTNDTIFKRFWCSAYVRVYAERMGLWGSNNFVWRKGRSSCSSLPSGIPSHDTLGRVFAAMDPTAFADCLTQWVSVLQEKQGRTIAIDGKTLRKSFDRAKQQSALHLVSAWATETGLSP